MNALNKLTGQGQPQNQNQQQGGGGGIMGGINNALGGGQKGEQNEDLLDKGVDYVQERMGGGDQSNESAAEQVKDEAISDTIRSQYKNTTGSDFPIADK
ncbi:hypothetical protein RSOLAG1IB_05645 [Rhizoctonia solani AG-1 IB]|uniref:DNA damage-responsive protein 48 n=1 Tax=Thanatephorus cucumeris (strain AG1-IB / isolate 7/3/14) TaxID=1108050 RepID=M5BL55_THACB|nr:hypothetical protein BN14_01499 [Rhizoctonia solani AG-1 IB]CEL63880.1 hypothetical protein RSOLAG1IB_05645 [Rhizoctonia solani AG-1 IB]